MQHAFNVEVARDYCVNTALVLKELYYQIKRNEMHQKYFYDGRYWCYCPSKQFWAKYSYLKPLYIKKSIEELEDAGLIVIANYSNDSTSGRFNWWYGLTEKGEKYCRRVQMNQEMVPNQ